MAGAVRCRGAAEKVRGALVCNDGAPRSALAPPSRTVSRRCTRASALANGGDVSHAACTWTLDSVPGCSLSTLTLIRRSLSSAHLSSLLAVKSVAMALALHSSLGARVPTLPARPILRSSGRKRVAFQRPCIARLPSHPPTCVHAQPAPERASKPRFIERLQNLLTGTFGKVAATLALAAVLVRFHTARCAARFHCNTALTFATVLVKSTLIGRWGVCTYLGHSSPFLGYCSLSSHRCLRLHMCPQEDRLSELRTRTRYCLFVQIMSSPGMAEAARSGGRVGGSGFSSARCATMF
jgi:hypothetical protein